MSGFSVMVEFGNLQLHREIKLNRKFKLKYSSNAQYKFTSSYVINNPLHVIDKH